MLRRRALTIVNWDPSTDGSVTATIAVRGRAKPVEVRLVPRSSVFSEHLALVATTFFLAFANRTIERPGPASGDS
jgi:hypothetical protein